MTCDEVGEWLQHFLDDELDDRRSARLAAHLDACRRCGLEVDVYRQIKHTLADSAAPLSAESVARLREFGERLGRGEIE
jgi:anti-sigma factor RsiW